MLRQVTVEGTVEKPTGERAEAGGVTFTPVRFADLDDQVIIPEIPVVADLGDVGDFAIGLYYSRVTFGDLYHDVYSDLYSGAVISAAVHYNVNEPAGDSYCIKLGPSMDPSILLNDVERC